MVPSAAMGRDIPVVFLAGGPHAVFLLDAFNAGDQVSNWVTRGDAMNTLAGKGVSAVAPAGGAYSMYTDWEMDGSKQWDTFLSRELPDWLAANKGLAPGGHAVVGASQGGYGALALAAFHPDRFRYAGSMSGFLSPSADGTQRGHHCGDDAVRRCQHPSDVGRCATGPLEVARPKRSRSATRQQQDAVVDLQPGTLTASDPASMIGYPDQAQGSNRTFYSQYRSVGGDNGHFDFPLTVTTVVDLGSAVGSDGERRRRDDQIGTLMGIGIQVEGLTKSFGPQRIWEDVTFDLPAGEVSVLLGPSGTGKSVFLKSLIGLLRPERGKIIVDGTNIIECSAKELYEIRTLFGVMFQDGALFGSMSLYDNTAFPLREHTKKKESEIRQIVMEKLELVGLTGDEGNFPGEISGGMRKRAGLARSLVLDPQIILCDEPDSGLDPVRTAYLSQLLIDINAQIDCTILIVTHNINIARTVPDNMGMLFRKHLVMFGPREVLLTSDEPVVKQFLNGRRIGPIGMSEEKDESHDGRGAGHDRRRSPRRWHRRDRGCAAAVNATPGMPDRKAVDRRQARVREIMHTLPPARRKRSARTSKARDHGTAHMTQHRPFPQRGCRFDRHECYAGGVRAVRRRHGWRTPPGVRASGAAAFDRSAVHLRVRVGTGRLAGYRSADHAAAGRGAQDLHRTLYKVSAAART